jgi:predicted transcriptional regulator
MVEDRRDRYGDPKSPAWIRPGMMIGCRSEWGDAKMPDEPPTASANRELAVKVISAYLRRNPVAADQLGILIATVHQTLVGLGEPAAEAIVERTPAVPIRRSVTPNSVMCLDCGWTGSMLRRHVSTAHGLSVEQYRARWNLPTDHAMTAPAYSERRSTMAKELGLGRTRGASAETMAVPETETQPAARRRGRPRSPTKPA